MEIQKIFSALGIGATKDEGQIKDAYRKKLVEVNPEDNPEGFKRLRKAYEDALIYATQKEEEKKNDPVSVYLKRVEELYHAGSMRFDVKAWEKLAGDELLDDLELGEDAKWGLFDFLADYYRLPSRIWRVLNNVFHFQTNEQEFKEHLPENFVNYSLPIII